MGNSDFNQTDRLGVGFSSAMAESNLRRYYMLTCFEDEDVDRFPGDRCSEKLLIKILLACRFACLKGVRL